MSQAATFPFLSLNFPCTWALPLSRVREPLMYVCHQSELLSLVNLLLNPPRGAEKIYFSPTNVRQESHVSRPTGRRSTSQTKSFLSQIRVLLISSKGWLGSCPLTPSLCASFVSRTALPLTDILKLPVLSHLSVFHLEVPSVSHGVPRQQPPSGSPVPVLASCRLFRRQQPKCDLKRKTAAECLPSPAGVKPRRLCTAPELAFSDSSSATFLSDLWPRRPSRRPPVRPRPLLTPCPL